jgi:hypothetical protein
MLNKSNSDTTLLMHVKQLAVTKELAKQKRMSYSLLTQLGRDCAEADTLEVEQAKKNAEIKLKQAFDALQQEPILTIRLSALYAVVQSTAAELNKIQKALELGSSNSTAHVYGNIKIYMNFYKELLATETKTKIVVLKEFISKLTVLQSQVAKVNCVYQAILTPSNALQEQHDLIYNLINSLNLLTINADDIILQPSCNLIHLDKNITLLLSEPISLCEAADRLYNLDENEYSVIQLYDDARAERNSQILHSLDTILTSYKEFLEMYSCIPEHGSSLKNHATDLKVIIADNVAGNLSTITDNSILLFIDNLTDEAASKLVIDLNLLLSKSEETASLAAAHNAAIITMKKLNDQELQKAQNYFDQNLTKIYLKIKTCSNSLQLKYDKIKQNLADVTETNTMEQTSHTLVTIATSLHDITAFISDTYCTMREELNTQVIDTLTKISKDDFISNLDPELLLTLANFLETIVPENFPATKPPMIYNFNTYRDNSDVSHVASSSATINENNTKISPRKKQNCLTDH